jgi:hypothetical protein
VLARKRRRFFGQPPRLITNDTPVAHGGGPMAEKMPVQKSKSQLLVGNMIVNQTLSNLINKKLSTVIEVVK